VIEEADAGRAGFGLPEAATRVADALRGRLWVLAWWAIGRAVVLAAALATRPTMWTLSEWDGRWYRIVARDGYLLVPGRQSDPAFFPLYPVLLRGGHAVGIDYEIAGPLLSNLALLAALALFEALTRTLFGAGLARRATIYLAIFPLGYVFSMTYPESIVLGLIVGAVLAATRGRWWLAGLCAACAALARPEGVFVALPLAALAWNRRRSLDPAARGAAAGAVLAPPAALMSYPLYLSSVLHDPLAWQRAQQTWGRRFRPLGLVSAVEHVPAALGHNPWLVRDVVALALYLVLLWLAWRAGSPRAWLLAGAAIVVLPAFSGAFDSIGRFGLLVPPLFWGLAAAGSRRHADRAIRVASLCLLAGATLTLPYVFP
jgi:hypothetical protein